MLVLTRKSEQKILIGNNIVITILRVCGDQVSVGIDAPKEMRIFREELVKEIPSALEASLAPKGAAELDVSSREAKTVSRLRKTASRRMHPSSPTPALPEVAEVT